MPKESEQFSTKHVARLSWNRCHMAYLLYILGNFYAINLFGVAFTYLDSR